VLSQITSQGCSKNLSFINVPLIVKEAVVAKILHALTNLVDATSPDHHFSHQANFVSEFDVPGLSNFDIWIEICKDRTESQLTR